MFDSGEQFRNQFSAKLWDHIMDQFSDQVSYRSRGRLWVALGGELSCQLGHYLKEQLGDHLEGIKCD